MKKKLVDAKSVFFHQPLASIIHLNNIRSKIYESNSIPKPKAKWICITSFAICHICSFRYSQIAKKKKLLQNIKYINWNMNSKKKKKIIQILIWME